uniref:Uncharacterized protein n=1 Tax=Candidatus Kentrum sp. FM TaxID=2126340 RepID=A0A450T5N1_9GAMM|nr:MAG: hypothetical protein BECKFM1743C_GA0114222_102812 [Candidatus Kentron sp. FM]VFJ61930.1 MAG: hypothetical protein BECKFM1743A_GA0114220_102958 [Candidatus Kentron sp. FM]VFK12835.1 MAG: hypothetical protein BECKFM1743B_GA0114221_102578 [Candidatus Kentron sp. FM]
MQVTDKAYQEHRVFAELERYAGFYEQLNMSVFSWLSMGTRAFCNIDSYVYSSMQGTIESIRTTLFAGRINDAYALLRKYHDSVIINVYSNLYLHDNFSIENFVVRQIHDWLHGKEKLPEYRKMSQYIRKSEVLKPITDLLYFDDKYKRLRDRCNDHAHYNFFQHVMLNDNKVFIEEGRLKRLEQFAEDIRDVFVLHLGYIFFLNDHYMMSSDYRDALDCDMEPEEGSEYWVAPFIQDIFNEIITQRRPDITATIKAKSAMRLL